MKRLSLLAMSACLVVGCRTTAPAAHGPYQEPEESALRQTAEAERLTKLAADLIEDDPERAEDLLRDALNNDLFFGPAHNNLGVIYLKQDRLYEAAGEFEWARKLMPGHPDPRLNLAITLERAGRDDDALAAYTAALEVYPDYLPAMQGLAKHAVLNRTSPKELSSWLQDIAMRSTDAEWRAWARRVAEGSTSLRSETPESVRR